MTVFSQRLVGFIKIRVINRKLPELFQRGAPPLSRALMLLPGGAIMLRQPFIQMAGTITNNYAC
ncbi:MAG: hypothetical protein DU429_03745 [Candidatus Tokpelaia sp.]|nr:MAG: hypothetical protein DU429_03745 [Candidatus Tokpelaia sp.]